jgi:hypothetical protein
MFPACNQMGEPVRYGARAGRQVSKRFGGHSSVTVLGVHAPAVPPMRRMAGASCDAYALHTHRRTHMPTQHYTHLRRRERHALGPGAR